jgi:hypothetical protein
MSDPHREQHERSISRMSVIAFFLAALVALVSIIYTRPLPVDDSPPPKVTSPR